MHSPCLISPLLKNNAHTHNAGPKFHFNSNTASTKSTYPISTIAPIRQSLSYRYSARLRFIPHRAAHFSSYTHNHPLFHIHTQPPQRNTHTNIPLSFEIRGSDCIFLRYNLNILPLIYDLKPSSLSVFSIFLDISCGFVPLLYVYVRQSSYIASGKHIYI